MKANLLVLLLTLSFHSMINQTTFLKDVSEEDGVIIEEPKMIDTPYENLINEELLSGKLTSVNSGEEGEINFKAKNLAATEGCSGKCFNANMNFPNDNYFITSYENWSASHGTPSVFPNSAWIWSANKIGEGMNFKHSFISGKNYCIESLFQQFSYSPNNLGSKYSKIVLTPNPVYAPPNGTLGQPIPSTPNPNQLLLNKNYVNSSNPFLKNYVINFTASSNYNNIWFYPYSASEQVNMQIKSLKICESYDDPCQYEVRIIKNQSCTFARFYSWIILPTGTSVTVTGYKWDFGDGTYSNEASPDHFYPSAGTYNGTLTIMTKNLDGKCCSKRFRFQIKVKDCDACTLLNYLNIKITNNGLIKFEPNLPHNNNYIYEWSFPYFQNYRTREVFKTSYINPVTLNVSYFDDRICCSKKITNRVYISLVNQSISATQYANFQADSYDTAYNKSLEIEYGNGISNVSLDDLDAILDE